MWISNCVAGREYIAAKCLGSLAGGITEPLGRDNISVIAKLQLGIATELNANR